MKRPTFSSIPWVVPLPRIPVTTRIIPFFVGNPNLNLHLWRLHPGRGNNEKYTQNSPSQGVALRENMKVCILDSWNSICLLNRVTPVSLYIFLVWSHRIHLGNLWNKSLPWMFRPFWGSDSLSKLTTFWGDLGVAMNCLRRSMYEVSKNMFSWKFPLMVLPTSTTLP